MYKIRYFTFFFLINLFLLTHSAFASDNLMPFTLASNESGDMDTVKKSVSEKLRQGGFEIIGEYSPYKDTHILVVTNADIKRAASSSKHGGYAAAIRVSLTKRGNTIQVSHNNPVYLANAYRLTADMNKTAADLKQALGFSRAFGSAKGLSAEALREYHYMFGMEYFDDPSKLGKFASHQQAVQAVESGLAAKKNGTNKVYRIDMPGKEEVLFGVQMTRDCSADEFIMGHIDFQETRSSAHLPYEILVSGNDVYALYARFRIAINFPDLKMMGDNSFMKIMCAPGEMEDALEAVVK